jgi:hypothetical protein
MNRNEFFRQNRRAAKSLADLQTEAEDRVTKAPGYEDLSIGQQRRKINDARAAAQKLYDKQQAELTGEDERLQAEYDKYKAGLKTDLDAYFAGRASEEQAAKDRLANTPFRQRYPELAGALPYIGIGLSAGVPFAGRAAANTMTWLPNSASRQLDAATARAEGATSAANMRDFNIAAGEINNALRSRPQSMLDQSTVGDAARIGAKNAIPYATTGLAGGGLAAEANMLPYQWDAWNLPPGDAQREAHRNAYDIGQYIDRGSIGTLTGMSGYKGANILVPRRQPNYARAEAAAKNPPSGGGGGALPSLVERRARPNPQDPAGHWVPPSPPGTPPAAGEQWVSPQGRNGVRWNDQLQRWQDDSGTIRPGPGRNYRRISSADDIAAPTSMAEFLRG